MRDNRRPRYTELDFDVVFSLIQTRLGTETLDSGVLKSYIEQIKYVVMNYINRNYVPEPLKFTVVSMTMDLLKSESANGFIENEVLSDISVGALSSVKDGDSELKFRTSSSTNTGVHVPDVDSLILNYKSHLDKYRLTRW